MNILPNNEKIEKYLDELADEYKTLLFKALVSRSKSVDDLSVSELLRLDNEIKKPLLEDYQKQQKRRRMLLTMGLTYMFLGFLTFIMFEIINGNFHYEMRNMGSLMSIIIGFVGLFTCILSFAMPTLSLSPNKHINGEKGQTMALLEYEVVTKWRELEGLVNDISINTNVKTPRSIIEFLADNHFVDENEYKLLKNFLKMRNDIVHSMGSEYSSDEINKLIDKIDKIIEKIKKIV
jgi:hypothetical protein